MNYKFLINIDKLFRPIYFIFNKLKWSHFENHDNYNFIVLKLFGIGSITRIAHVIDCCNLDKHKVTFITLDKNKSIIDLLGLNAIYIKTKNPFISIISMFNITYQIWNKKQVSILDMERNSNLAGLFRLLIGIAKPCYSFSFDEENRKIKGQFFVSLKNKPVVQAIAEMFNKSYPIAELNTLEENHSNTVFININAGDYLPERKFPLSQYAQLIKELHHKEPDWNFHLTGSKFEIDFVISFKAHLIKAGIPSNKIFVIAGKHNLSDFVKALQKVNLFITNDSGPLHLAYMYGVKTVGIWGPTSSKIVGYEDSHRMLNLETNIFCSPCFTHPKSSVATYCDGNLTCFKIMSSKEMASKIIKFVGPQNQRY